MVGKGVGGTACDMTSTTSDMVVVVAVAVMAVVASIIDSLDGCSGKTTRVQTDHVIKYGVCVRNVAKVPLDS